MKSLAPIARFAALASAALCGRAVCSEAPEPIRALYEHLKLNLPDGWEMAYLGEAPGTEKWPANLRFAFALKRSKKVELVAHTISGPPPGAETELQHLRLIVYPEARRRAKGLGWHAFMYRRKHFSLREPFAGIGTYEVGGTPETRRTVQRELDLIKELILSSGKAARGPASK